MTGNIHEVDLVNMNVCIKFGEILPLCSQDMTDGMTDEMTDNPNPV